MLTPGIHAAYLRGLCALENAGASLVAVGSKATGEVDGRSALFEVEGERFLAEPLLAQEVFGPCALLVKVKDEAELLRVARSFKGQLSATLHLEQDDWSLARRVLPTLERRTGRIVINAFAHPQEVCFATVHGGPFPATSDSRFTSVGMTAITASCARWRIKGFRMGCCRNHCVKATLWSCRGLWMVIERKCLWRGSFQLFFANRVSPLSQPPPKDL